MVQNSIFKNAQFEAKSYDDKKGQPMYIIFAAVVASVGGVLFGYDIGITSGALLQLRSDFNLTSFEQEMIVSSVLIGAFCASFFGGNIVDTWGRKVGIGLSCLLFIIGALILFFSINFIMIIVGRLTVGIAVSLSVTAECTYISEISPPSRRGMMVSLNEVGITAGFLLAYLVNFFFITINNGWRYMFGAAAILAIIQGFGVAFMPNSHHYLLVKGETDKARKVLRRLRDTDDIDEEMEAIITSIEEQKNRKYVDLFSSNSNMRGRMLLGMTLVFLQQFSGNANVLYYAPTVFQHFGYKSDSLATLVTVGLGVVKVLSTIVTLTIVDKVGRRTLLLTGCLLMATSIMILGAVGTVKQNKLKHEGNKPFIIHHSIVLPNHPIEKKIISLETSSNPSENEEQIDNLLFHQDIDFKKLENSTEGSNLKSTLNFVTQSVYYDLINNTKSKNKTLSSNIVWEDILNFDDVHISTTEIFPLFENTDSNISASSIEIELMNETANFTTEEDLSEMSYITKIVSVVSLMVFVCAYGVSYGPVTWLVLSEIFPGSLRGRAVSVATCINWGSNIIISLTFLDVLNAVGIGPTFIAYGFISYGAAIFIFFCVPETKNKTLEEINALLSKGLLQRDKKICTFSINHDEYAVERTNFAMNMKSDKPSQDQKNYRYLDEAKNTYSTF